MQTATITRPRNLAELKRYLQKGVKIELVNTSEGRPSERISGVRTVETVQTNAVTFIKEGGRQSWLRHEPARCYTFTEKGFRIGDPNNPKFWLEYEWR